MSYTKKPLTSASNGAILNKLNTNKILSATALSTVATFVLTITWHKIIFKKQYHTLFNGEQQQQLLTGIKEDHDSSSSSAASASAIFSLSVISVILQNLIISVAYSLVKLIAKSSLSLAFLKSWAIPAFALYHWSTHVLGYVGEGIVSDMREHYRPELVFMFVLLESVYEVFHFTVVGFVVVMTISKGGRE